MATTFTSIYGFDKPALGDPSWGAPRNTNMDDIDAELARERVPFLSPAVGGTTTCDLDQTNGARVFVFTVTQATTLAFTNVPSSSFECEITLIITNGSAFVVTWPASVVWMGGAGPALRASGVDVIRLITKDGGTTWYASKMASNPLIYQNQGLTTTGTVEASVASFSVPAGMLNTNGQALRFTLVGQVTTQNATAVKVKFGATELGFFTPVAGRPFTFTGTIVRTGAATQIANIQYIEGLTTAGGFVQTARATPAETLANAITLDFRASVTAGGTIFFDAIEVEFLGR